MAIHDDVVEVNVDFSDVERRIEELNKRLEKLEALVDSHSFDQDLIAEQVMGVLYKKLVDAAKGTRQT